MKPLLVTLAVCLLVLGGSKIEAPKAESQYVADQREAKVAFKAACAMTNYSCKRIKVPTVRRSTEVGHGGAYGVYFDGSVLWVDEGLLTARSRLTIFHEMVHYLQAQYEPWTKDHMQLCIYEKEALDYTNEYGKSIGLDQFFRSVAEWRKLYRCT